MASRLLYYQDAHHYHAKRLDPPITLSKLQYPVDELAGTGVDTLLFGLGYGDVYFHESQAGRVVGEDQEEWSSFIDWRIMRMVTGARALGTDQLRVVIERGRETGVGVVPSLKLQSADRRTQGASSDEGGIGDRCGRLKWERWEEVCMRIPDDPGHERYECTRPLPPSDLPDP